MGANGGRKYQDSRSDAIDQRPWLRRYGKLGEQDGIDPFPRRT